MSAAAARFTFDLDLGHVGEKRRVLTEGALADMLAAARAEGRAEGLAEGENGTNARAAQALAAAANALASRTVEMAAAMDDARTEILADAVNVAASVGRKLAHNLMARQPLVEIEALVRECLSGLDTVPHLVIRCAPDLADAVKETATAAMATSSFAGRLVVMGDPDQHLHQHRARQHPEAEPHGERRAVELQPCRPPRPAPQDAGRQVQRRGHHHHQQHGPGMPLVVAGAQHQAQREVGRPWQQVEPPEPSPSVAQRGCSAGLAQRAALSSMKPRSCACSHCGSSHIRKW